MTDIFYTSDPHFGHKKVTEIRGFESIEEHDETLVANWNEVVRPKDIVWILGDFCLSSGGLRQASRLNGTKHLILGNHDGPFPQNRNSHNTMRKWMEYFDSVQLAGRRKIGDTEFLMHHMPYNGDHTEAERHIQWRLRDEGMLLAHGHLHCPEVLHPDRPRQVHVGMDAWNLRPMPQDALSAFLDAAQRPPWADGS